MLCPGLSGQTTNSKLIFLQVLESLWDLYSIVSLSWLPSKGHHPHPKVPAVPSPGFSMDYLVAEAAKV